MRKFATIATALMLGSVAFSAQAQDCYLVGAFNRYTTRQAEWALQTHVDSNGDADSFFGTFEIPAGEYEFYFHWPLYPPILDYRIGAMNYKFVGDDVQFSDAIVDSNNFTGQGQLITNAAQAVYKWIYPNWPGGTIDITLNMTGDPMLNVISHPSGLNTDTSMSFATVTAGPQDNTYQVVANQLELTWPDQVLHFTADKPTIQYSYNGGTLRTAPVTHLGKEYDQDDLSSIFINLSQIVNAQFDMETFTYTYDYGTYEIIIPAGIVANEKGDENPEQTVRFVLCRKLSTDPGEGLDVTPAQSIPDWDDMGNEIPAAVYASAQLKDITLSWPGYQVEATDVEGLSIQGYAAVETQGGNPVYVDLTKYVTIKNGDIHLDLSDSSVFGSGIWSIDIPQGYVKATVNNVVYTNGGITLTYNIDTTLKVLEYVSITSPSNPEDYYQTYLNQVQLSYGSTEISLVENGPKVTFSYNGGEPQECELSVVRNSMMQTYSLRAYFGDTWGNVPGLYKVNFPAGVVTDGTAVNAAADFEWYMVATTDNYTVSPESGEYSYTGTTYPIVATGDLKEIKITFDGYKSVAINNHSWYDITVYYAPEEDKINQYGNLSLGKDAVSVNGNVATITLPEVGEYFYQIWIPDMDFVIDDDYINESIVLYYHAWNGLPEPEVLSAPAPVSGPYPNSIMLTWDYTQLTPAENGLSVVATWGSEYNSAAGWFGYYDIPADAIRLVNLEKPGEGGGISPTAAESGNVLMIDLVPYVKIENENVHNVKVTIPAGIVMNTEGQCNSQISFEFDIYNIYPKQPVCTQGSQPGIYDIEWPDVSNLDATEGEVFIINGNGERFELSQGAPWDWETGEGQYRVAYDNENDSWSLQVNLNGMNIPGGEYELIIPEGLVVISDNDENSYTNGDCYFNVEVPDAPIEEDVIYVLGNFNNYTISNQWKLVLDDEYNDYNGFFENVPAGNLDFYLDYLGIIIIPAEGEDAVEFTNNTFEGGIDYSMAPDAAYWTIANWPGGSLNIHVDGAEEIIYIYAFPISSDIPLNPDYTISYEEGIVTIAWEGVDEVWFENYTASYLLDANGNEIELKAGFGAPLQSFSEEEGICGVTLDMTALNVVYGEYTLVIPEGTLQVVSGDWENWDYNPDISYKFTYEDTTGVNGISADENIEVYNLQGVRILKSNDASAVSTLENGIYIINGKKVIIRK